MIPFLIAGAVGFGIAKLLEEDTKKFADGGETNPPSPQFINQRNERISKLSVAHFYDKLKSLKADQNSIISDIEILFHISKEQTINILKEYNRYNKKQSDGDKMFSDVVGKANQLRKDRYAKPTEAQVKKYLGKGIYKENRRNKSDRDRNEKI